MALSFIIFAIAFGLFIQAAAPYAAYYRQHCKHEKCCRHF
jgi:hypothetical protein